MQNLHSSFFLFPLKCQLLQVYFLWKAIKNETGIQQGKKEESNKQQSEPKIFCLFQSDFIPLKHLQRVKEELCEIPTALWTFIGTLKLFRHCEEEKFENVI